MSEAVVQALGIALGFVLTLMIFSYLLGDNPLFRLAVYVLVGVGAGYAAVVLAYAVIIPQLVAPVERLWSGAAAGVEDQIQPLVILLAFLLLLKLSPRTAPLGNTAMAFVIGVGAAVAVGGAILGTLLPQISATALPLFPDAGAGVLPDSGALANALAALVVITGTTSTLLYFHFTARPVSEGQTQRPEWLRPIAWIGQVFLTIAFGSLFAGALIASLSVLTERMQFLVLAPGELLRLLNLGGG